MNFIAKFGFMVVNITGTLFVHKCGLKITSGAGPPCLQGYFIVAVVSLHTMVTVSGQFLKHCLSGSSTCLLKCFLGNSDVIRCINLGSGNSAGICENSKCEGVQRLRCKNDDLQSLLKYFCGTGTLLKWFSYDTQETYF